MRPKSPPRLCASAVSSPQTQRIRKSARVNGPACSAWRPWPDTHAYPVSARRARLQPAPPAPAGACANLIRRQPGHPSATQRRPAHRASATAIHASRGARAAAKLSGASGAQPMARRCRPSAAATSIRRRRLLARAHPAHPLSARLAAVRPARSSLRPRRPAHARPVAQRIGARGAGARCARPSPRVQQRGRRHASRPDAAARRRHAAERTGACSPRGRPAGVYGAPPARQVATRHRTAAVRTPARRAPR